MSSKRLCTKPGCGRPHSAHGLCKNHDQLRRTSERVEECTSEGCFRITAFPGTDKCQTHHKHRLTNPNKAIKRFRKPSEVLSRNHEGFKRCTRCEAWKAESDFHDASHTSDRKQPECKVCLRERNQLHRFNMTPGDYNDLLVSQGSVCAICQKPPTDMRLAIDHDHGCCPRTDNKSTSCGVCVRGLLCRPCNQMLGMARDEVSTLVRAVNYLKDWNSK